ncbi:MAG: tetratricopeptide repeat protein [Promethearchaeota archaeon]
MKLTSLTIKDLITPKAKLTFLVGAGCSVDAPSCLPAGKSMMEAIINFVCADSEIEKILKLEDLRFEQLVEIVRDHLDNELKVIDYYGQCDKPNIQHFFLVEMIKNGHFVMTTNFDFLIEYALQQSGLPKNKIIPVITRGDFERFSDPQELFNIGKKALYKVHGSTQNIITGEETRESLIATIQAFGSNKEGLNVFQVEPFKRELFDNISNGRSLVVMGYSGSDDFDIVPTLKVLKNLQNIVWINYSEKNKIGKEKIYEIDANTNQELDVLDGDLRKVTQILFEICRGNNAAHIYRVDINTTEMAKILSKSKQNLSLKDFSIKPRDWLEKNITAPDEFDKYYIPYKIHKDFGKYDDAMICSKKILQLAKKSQNKSNEASALNNIATIYDIQGNYPEAIKHFEAAFQIFEQIGNLGEKATALSNIGTIYKKHGNYPEALKRFEETLQINEQLGNQRGKAIVLENIGMTYSLQEKYPEALQRLGEALKIYEQLGDLKGKAFNLIESGDIFRKQGNYPEALQRLGEALQIDEQLGNLREKANALNNIGMVYVVQGNFQEALNRYEEALEISEQLGDLETKVTLLNNISRIHYDQNNYHKALKYLEKALEIIVKIDLEDSPTAQIIKEGIIIIRRKMSENAKQLIIFSVILEKQGKTEEAIKRLVEALQICEQIGDLLNKATILNNIGFIYHKQQNYNGALEKYEEALKIDEQLGYLSKISTRLNNIAEVHFSLENYDKALEKYKEALKYAEKSGLNESPNTQMIKRKIKDLKDIMYLKENYDNI